MSTGVAYPRCCCCCTRLRLLPPERMAWAAWRMSVGDEDETDEQTGQPQCDLCSDCMSRVTALRGSAREADVAISRFFSMCRAGVRAEERGCSTRRQLGSGLSRPIAPPNSAFPRPADRVPNSRPGARRPRSPQLRGDPRLSCFRARDEKFELPRRLNLGRLAVRLTLSRDMLAVCCSGFKRAVIGSPAASLGSIATAASTSSAASSHRRQPPQPRRPRPQASDRDADSYKLAEQVKQLVAAGSRRSSAASSPTASSTGDAYAPALNLIRSAPASAATVVVWNVLLNAVLVPGSDGSRGGGGQQQQHAAAVRRAYEIWMEMKRRGVVPTGRSYGTFLTGVAKRAKRAASELEHRSAGHHHSRALEGWNAELRAKVETVHKQWRMHCERVLERAERQGGPSSSSSSGEGGGQDDGRHDSIESLSPLPTNQYLSFLSASLTLSLATGSSGTAPVILDHLVRTFEAIPDPDVDPRLGRTTVSYQVVLGAFKTVLQQAAGAVAPEEPVQTADTVEDGFKVLPPLDRPSQVGSETAVFPTAHQISERALAMWDHLVSNPPSPELPSPGSPSSSFSPLPAAPLPLILPTALLSLYLSTPSSSTATLPPATHARFLTIPQLAFGFVSPSRIADLEPPHPDELVVPLCGGGAPGGATLDRAAFGAALRTARRAAVAAGAESSTRWTRAWWDQVRDYPERFGLERGLGGPEEGEVGQVRLMDREAAQEVMKAAGRAGDVESIEGEPLFCVCVCSA